MKCIYCGKEINGHEMNSAAPLHSDEYCCADCNMKVVVPYRVFLSTYDKKDTALWVKQDRLELVKPKGAFFTLGELQNAVGGYIEIAPALDRDYMTVVDEEGLLKGLPLNNLFLKMFDRKIVGNVLVVPRRIFEAPEED